MKKSTKLLSVLLAVVMIFSSLSVVAFAYGDYKNVGEEYYDTNDNPRTFLYTDEQRASIVMDLLDGILGDLNLVNTKILGIKVDLTSYDGIVETFSNSLVRTLVGSAGQLEALDYSAIQSAKSRSAGGDVAALESLLKTVALNGGLVYRILNDGKIDLGIINNFLPDMTSVNNILSDLPSFLGGTIYDLTARKLPIGNDPALPNATPWADLATKPSFDVMLKDIIMSLLTEPNKQVRITDPSQNTLGDQAIAENTVDEDGNPVTYYYCYGVDTDGTLLTKGEEKDKVYLTRWNLDSAMVKGESATVLNNLIDFTGKDLYTLLEQAAPWAYDTYGAPNLDGQLRATLMQFSGAVNRPVTDEAVKAQLKEKMDSYKQIQNESGAKALSNAFKAAVGDAGNYNFMYLSLGTAQSINDKPDNLYYVVEWGGNYEYYKVDFTDVNGFFPVADWEYQISDWASLTADYTAGTSLLAHLSDIVGRILVQAVPSIADIWTYGGNSNINANVTALVKMFIKLDPVKIFGKGFELPANFDSMDLEDVAVMIAKVVMGNLMPSLVLPEDVSSLEAVLVYGVREYCAEILPEYGEKWDQKIAAASTEDAYLDIALNMGTTIGMYYLRNLIGVGTFNGKVEVPPMGPDYTWQEILDYAIDWVLATWVPGLTSNIVAKNAAAFNGSDPLAKLSAILSYLAPSTVKLIGCSSDSYALDANVLYNKIRVILNGDLQPAFAALERKESGTVGNKSVCAAIVTLVEELFGGLGFETAENWANLKGSLDNAAAAAEPIQALIGAYGTRTQLASLARDLVACVGQTRAIWAQDAIKIVTSFVGGFSDALKDSGMTYDGPDAYAGASSYTVDYTLGMKATGVRTAFNSGAYKTGETTFDGTYQIEVLRTEVHKADGTVVNTTPQTAKFSANESVALSTEIPEGKVPVQPEVFTIVTVYKMVMPSGDYVNKGAELSFSKNVIVTSLVNDNLVPVTKTYTNEIHQSVQYGVAWSKKTAVNNLDVALDYSVKNTYISERQNLSDAANIMLTLTDRSTEYQENNGLGHTNTKIYIDGYGWHRDENGKIKVYDAESGGNLVNLDGKVDITLNGNKINAQDVWFKWNINMSELNNPGLEVSTSNGVALNASKTVPLWAIETGTYRTDFSEDFNVYKITATPKMVYNYHKIKGGTILGQSSESVTVDLPIESYIILYNSYNLENTLNGVLNRGIVAGNYDLTTAAAQAAWTEYQAALANATLQLYGQWNAATFQADHTTTADYSYKDGDETKTLAAGSSTFQVAGIRLNNAVDELAKYVKADASESAAIAPSDPASDLYPAYQAIQAQNARGYNNQNYILYRWYKYYDARRDIENVLNAATPPAGVAYNKLAGVNLDNDGINAVVNTITDESIKTLANAMIVAPTAEETAAAQQKLQDFAAPKYDVTSVMSTVGEMQTNEQRLLPKYGTCQAYYLNDAIADQGNVAAAGYTAESYAAYSAALATAKNVSAAAAANTAKQSEIHQARYDLLVAYNRLVATAEAADFTQLEAVIAQANNVLANQDLYQATAASGMTTQEALVELLANVGYKTTYNEETYYIGGNDTGAAVIDQKGTLVKAKKQSYVDWVAANIQTALANLELIAAELPELNLSDYGTEGGAVLAKTENYAGFAGCIFGIDTPSGESLLDYLAATAGQIEILPNEEGCDVGTGATINLLDADGNVVESYLFILFGDVNGDGYVDSVDTGLVAEAEVGLSEYTHDYCELAADFDGSGYYDSVDAGYVLEYEVGLYEASQATIAAEVLNNYSF